MKKKAEKLAVKYTDVNIQFSESHTSAMIMCRCGDVFRASGTSASVRRKQSAWTAKHTNCKDKPRDARKVFWLSFCDSDKPKGEQFLGACVIDVTAAEAELATLDVMLMFPLAQPDAEWIAAATRKAHQLGCNPGGEVASMEIPTDHPNLKHYRLGVLMDKAECERIDLECGFE